MSEEKKPRVQFGIRSLLILITLSAVGFSVYRRYTAYLAIDAIQKKAQFVRPQPKAQGWRRLYSNDVYRVHHLSFHSSFGVTDDDVAAITRLPWIRRLSLHRTEVTDAACAYVAKLKLLEAVSFEQTKVTDAGLAQLQDLKKLKSVSLNRLPAVSQQGLEYLSGMTEMEELLLSGTSADSLEFVRNMPKLRRLELGSNVQLGGDSLAYLRDKNELQKLSLLRIAANNEDFRNLHHARKLHVLRLHNTNLRNLHSETWQHLSGLQKLWIDCSGLFHMEDHDMIQSIEVSGALTDVSLRTLPNLTRVRFRPIDTNDPTTSLSIENCRNLAHLTVNNFRHVRIANLPALRSLSLYNHDSLSLEGLSLLQQLNVFDSQLNDSLMDELIERVNATNIVALRFDACEIPDVRVLERLLALRRLKTLDFRSYRNQQMVPLPTAQRDLLAEILPKFSSLHRIVLSKEMTNAKNIHALGEISSLKQIELQIPPESDVSKTDYTSLLQLPNLETLVVWPYVRHENGGIGWAQVTYQSISAKRAQYPVNNPREKRIQVNGRNFAILQ